jgi:hypothetical protein
MVVNKACKSACPYTKDVTKFFKGMEKDVTKYSKEAGKVVRTVQPDGLCHRLFGSFICRRGWELCTTASSCALSSSSE